MKCVHSLLMLDPRLLLRKRKVRHTQVKSVQVPLFKINQLPPSILLSFLTKTGIYSVFIALSLCLVFFFFLFFFEVPCKGSVCVVQEKWSSYGNNLPECDSKLDFPSFSISTCFDWSLDISNSILFSFCFTSSTSCKTKGFQSFDTLITCSQRILGEWDKKEIDFLIRSTLSLPKIDK